MIGLLAFLLWFFLVTFLTFSFWLEPSYNAALFGKIQHKAWAGSLLTLLFFMNCFIVGVLISIYQMKGVL